jgi:hypothetical protein
LHNVIKQFDIAGIQSDRQAQLKQAAIAARLPNRSQLYHSLLYWHSSPPRLTHVKTV